MQPCQSPNLFTNCVRLYMLDGLYQSAMCFFMGYLLFAPATFLTESGRGVEARDRMGVYVACATIFVINSYILLNTYRWDWLILLITAISTLLIWFWTGVYSSFKSSFQFYKSAAEVYGTLAFWLLSLLIVIASLLPRFCIKFFQKYFRPYDIDIIREHVRQGKFDYLDEFEAFVAPNKTDPTSSPDADQPLEASSARQGAASVTDSQRPIYPPSEARAGTTRNPRSHTGSDGTDKTGQSISTDAPPVPPPRPSYDRMRNSYDRSRKSFDKLRPSYEGSRDFTSAAMLTRVESSHSNTVQSPATPHSRRRLDATSELQ